MENKGAHRRPIIINDNILFISFLLAHTEHIQTKKYNICGKEIIEQNSIFYPRKRACTL